jgi:hypothetical protein
MSLACQSMGHGDLADTRITVSFLYPMHKDLCGAISQSLQNHRAMPIASQEAVKQ